MPANLTQNGPARIVSVSQNPSLRNMTLGQGVFGSTGDRVEVRLRTTSTSNNGRPAVQTAVGTLGLGLQHVVYTRDSAENVAIYDRALSAEEVSQNFQAGTGGG